jgi:hypothetical protein
MMIYTLIFGSPVVADGKTLGKVERILVHGGIANQFTVDPGLFGTERVVPVSDVRSTTAEGIELKVAEDAWKAYPAFDIESMLPAASEPSLHLADQTPQPDNLVAHRLDTGVPSTSTDVPADDITVTEQSAVLSAKTTVVANGTERRLHGLVLDTGRPVQALVEGEQPLDLQNMRGMTSEEIRV